MELQVIGNWGGSPGADSACSGYLVSHQGTRLLMDCGPGVVPSLQRFISCGDLTAVYISHMHADHCLDLIALAYRLIRYTWRYEQTNQEQQNRIPLFLPPGGSEVIGHLLNAFGRSGTGKLADPFSSVFDIQECEPGETLQVGSLELELFSMKHAVPCNGVRVSSDDGVIAYTGDTGWCTDLLDLARDADILLCDSAMRQPSATKGGDDGHLTATQAGTAAQQANAQRLLLTHLSRQDSEWCQGLVIDAGGEFRGRAEIARHGAVYTVGQRPVYLHHASAAG